MVIAGQTLFALVVEYRSFPLDGDVPYGTDLRAHSAAGAVVGYHEISVLFAPFGQALLPHGVEYPGEGEPCGNLERLSLKIVSYLFHFILDSVVLPFHCTLGRDPEQRNVGVDHRNPVYITGGVTGLSQQSVGDACTIEGHSSMSEDDK